MTYNIDECNDLYVLEEINCRGVIRQNKFKIQVPLIKQAVSYALLSQDEKMEEEIDEFLISFKNHSITSLLASIITCKSLISNLDPTSFMTKLKEEGRFSVESEEQAYGVGVTKELAYQAFSEVQFISDDEGWD